MTTRKESLNTTLPEEWVEYSGNTQDSAKIQRKKGQHDIDMGQNSRKRDVRKVTVPGMGIRIQAHNRSGIGHVPAGHNTCRLALKSHLLA